MAYFGRAYISSVPFRLVCHDQDAFIVTDFGRNPNVDMLTSFIVAGADTRARRSSLS
jgi:hypothetical protein